MRASMRPAGGDVRWGRVLTGILVVACVTFALAYHLPLQRAHGLLTTRYAELQSKATSASRSAQDERARAKQLTDKNQTLQRRVDEIEQREKAHAESSRTLKTAIEPKLQKPLAANQAAIALAAGQPVISLSLGHLLTAGKLEVSPQGKTTLCTIASASTKHTVRVLAIAEKKDIPAALAPTHKSPLEYTLAVAQLVTQTLIDKCRADATKLTATGVPSANAANAATAKLDGKKLTGARVELWLESAP
jgi:hypothetical protein